MPYLKKPIKQHNKAFKREERQKIYQSARWKELRQSKLMQQPLCELCLAKGIVTPAIDVHHIDSFMNYIGIERLAKAFDYKNLQSVCKFCHSSLHCHE